INFERLGQLDAVMTIARGKGECLLGATGEDGPPELMRLALLPEEIQTVDWDVVLRHINAALDAAVDASNLPAYTQRDKALLAADAARGTARAELLKLGDKATLT